MALALPGGAIGQRFGDKRTVLAALVLMLAGSLAMALTHSWSWQIAGRLTAGAGGVLLNVQLTKMVTDWFAGKEIATAMAIFVSSWPVGIALSLLTLPLIGTAYGIGAVISRCSIGGARHRPRRRPIGRPRKSRRPSTPATASAWPDTNSLVAVTVAGLIWGLFNVGFAIDLQLRPTCWSSAAGRSRRQAR